MAYFTEINYGRVVTEAEQAQITSYVQGQVAAGTTDGNLYTWSYEVTAELNGSERVRMWSTIEAANGMLAVVNSFTPPAQSAKVF